MIHCSFDRIVVLIGLGVLGCLASSTVRADDTDWTVRLVAPGVSVDNIDVMAGLDGEAIVGYATPAETGSGGDVVVARLPAGGGAFQLRTELGGGDVASFAADRFGNVFYSSRDFVGGGIRAGQDFGGFGNLWSSHHSTSSIAVPSAVPTMRVNPGGMPVLADMDQSGARFLSTFSVIQRQWQTETVTGVGLDSPAEPAGPNCQSLTFDSAGNPVLAYVQRTGSPLGPLVVAHRGTFGWTNLADDTATAMYGASLAAAPSGAIGCAYTDGSGRLSFSCYTEEADTKEMISEEASHLTPRSMAFDAAGNPAIVYSEAPVGNSFNPLHLARRDAQGNWTDEVLPVDSRMASLTFDAEGSPLVAAYTSSGVALLGKGLIPEPGDANRDGNVDDLDASILAAHWLTSGGATWEQGDFNGDGKVDDLDASILAANWLSGVGAAVPEPSTLALLAGLAVMGSVCCQRRKTA